MIRHPDDVHYVSYERMEPVGAMIALAANYAQRAYWPARDEESMTDLAGATAGAMFDYMKRQSFLSSFAILAEFANARDADSAMRTIDKFLNRAMASQKPYSAALSLVERQLDSTMPDMGAVRPTLEEYPEMGIDRSLAELWAKMESYLKAWDSGVPGRDPDAPVLRDRFATPRQQRNATVLEGLMMPFMADIVGDNPETVMNDPVFRRVVAAGVPLSRVPDKIEGIRLNPDEKETFEILAGNPKLLGKIPDRDGDGNLIPGTDIGLPSLYDRLMAVITSRKDFDKLPLEVRQSLFKSADQGTKDTAKTMILKHPFFEEQFRDLRARIAAVEAERDLPEQVK